MVEKITSRTSILMKMAKIYANDRQVPKFAPWNWLNWPWAREVDFAIYVHEVYKPTAETTLNLGARIELGIGDTVGPHMMAPYYAPMQPEQIATRIREGVGFYAGSAAPPANGSQYGSIATQDTAGPLLVSRTLIMGQPEARIGFSYTTSNQESYALVTVLAHGRA